MGVTTAVTGETGRDTFEEHRQDEGDAAFLYRELARAESDPRRRDVFERLAAVEDEHRAIWERVLGTNASNGKLAPFKPSTRARIMAYIGRYFGAKTLLNLLLREVGC